MKSPKEIALEKRILRVLADEKAVERLAHILIEDREIQDIQDYANTVAIKRLGYNDHGPVHMRQVALNSMRMLGLLHQAGIKTSLEAEETGTYGQSIGAVLLAAFLHDLGMSIGRQDHEIMSAVLAAPIIGRVLGQIDSWTPREKTMISCLALEGIVGHMATRKIHSLEAGLILVADGCDMERGRARIPLALSGAEAHVGDIHKHSANSIQSVEIGSGDREPVKISVKMTSEVGCFQIEEVLLPKINMSPAKKYVELVALIGDEERRYL